MVEVCVIFSSRENVPEAEANFSANVCLTVDALATVELPKLVGSTTIPTFLKSFPAKISSDSAPVNVVLIQTKCPPNSLTALEPCPPFGEMITSIAPPVPPTAAAVVRVLSEKVFPELVHGDEGSKTLQYSGLIGVLIEAIKDLSVKVKKLESN